MLYFIFYSFCDITGMAVYYVLKLFTIVVVIISIINKKSLSFI